ncbi:hypothetical protein COU36_01585 [Candidatus Micrarchaeota archaeon CG10_big_fil_rev_8_21_14_0_10_59_7]|nr:MAG: hypothetical protein COU36_01585 [Candidatus Micrarchaeota archaeon CG10_big_fil_rev_8_21_14_0_10_59_7]
MRAQTSVEYVFIVAFIVTLAVVVMITVLRETELNMAVGAARMAAFEEASAEGITLAEMDYSVSHGIVSLTPRLYGADGGAVPASEAVRQRITQRVKQVLAPYSQTENVYCVTATNYMYCA